MPATPEELARLLDSRRPEAIAAIGGVGLALIVWLMIFKPAQRPARDRRQTRR